MSYIVKNHFVERRRNDSQQEAVSIALLRKTCMLKEQTHIDITFGAGNKCFYIGK